MGTGPGVGQFGGTERRWVGLREEGQVVVLAQSEIRRPDPNRQRERR